MELPDENGAFEENRRDNEAERDRMFSAHFNHGDHGAEEYYKDINNGSFLGPEATYREAQSEDWNDENVNQWLRARLEYGIDEEPYKRELVVPDAVRKQADNFALASRLDQSAVEQGRAHQDAARHAQIAAAQQIRSMPRIAPLAGRLRQEQAQQQIAAQLAQRGNNAASQRAAISAQGQTSAQLGTSAALQQAQERLAMQQAFGRAQGGIASGDVKNYGQEVGYAQDVGKHNLARENARLQHYGRGMNMAQNDVNRAIGLNNLKHNIIGTKRGRAVQLQNMQNDMINTAVSANANMLGSYIQSADRDRRANQSTSDVRAKEDVASDDRSVREFLSALKPYSYTYRDEERHGKGRHTGVMAQDLEQSEVGQRMVGEGPDGMKTVDYSPRSLGPVTLASLASLHRRIEAQERKK